MPTRARRLPSFLVLLLPLLAGAPARADEARHAVPEARPVQLDGRVVPAEWSAAVRLPMDDQGTELWLQQYRGTLMLGLSSPRDWDPGSSLTLWLCPDGPQAGAEGPGRVRIEVEPFEHDRRHVIASRRDEGGGHDLDGEVVARASILPGHSELELAVGLAALGMEGQRRPALRACALWSRAGGPSPVWPAGLDLRSAPGQPPANLVSAAHWGVLEGWGDPAGPGAFSKTEWQAWVQQDRQVAEHGRTAHHAVNLLVEEWKKTKKQDAELVPEVLGNLRAVREHERLTGNDLLAMATVLRYLNRHQQALGMLEALAEHPRAVVRQRALRDRALLFESMQRYPEAVADWNRLAALTSGPWRTSYVQAAQTDQERAQGWETERAARAKVEADPDEPRVRLRTNRGEIELVLHAKDLPQQAAHFLELVRTRFYDKTLFHRVHGDYLAQGGDPLSRDQGLAFAGSGTSPKEVALEISDEFAFWRGAVGFARPMREFNGSQFFIMTAPRPDLGEYTCFAHVVRGQEVADRLELGDTLLEARVVER